MCDVWRVVFGDTHGESESVTRVGGTHSQPSRQRPVAVSWVVVRHLGFKDQRKQCRSLALRQTNSIKRVVDANGEMTLRIAIARVTTLPTNVDAVVAMKRRRSAEKRKRDNEENDRDLQMTIAMVTMTIKRSITRTRKIGESTRNDQVEESPCRADFGGFRWWLRS
jgi:hypothetical protein